MAWATAIGPIISRQPRQSSRFDPAHYPLAANILLILIPSLMVTSIVPLSFILGRTFDDCYATFVALDSKLVQASIDFEQGVLMDPTSLSTMVDELQGRSASVSLAWRNTWLLWCFYIVVLFAVRPLRIHPNSTHSRLAVLHLRLRLSISLPREETRCAESSLDRTCVHEPTTFSHLRVPIPPPHLFDLIVHDGELLWNR